MMGSRVRVTQAAPLSRSASALRRIGGWREPRGPSSSGRGRSSAAMIATNSSSALAAAEPRIARLFLADAADPTLLIIVAGIDQRVVGQREELVVDRAVERRRVAVLEVGTAATVDQQRVAGEQRARRRPHPADSHGDRRCARGVERLEAQRRRSRAARPSRTATSTCWRRSSPGTAHLATGRIAQPRGAGHMIGVDMGFERIFERETELARSARSRSTVSSTGSIRTASRVSSQPIR